MHESAAYSGNRVGDYALVARQAESLWEKDLPLFSNLANVSALLKEFLDQTNWAGFYLWDAASSQLVLGPFQGLPACTRIAFGKGVCGTALKERATQRVADVHLFPGHIACDGASASEIVVPLIRDGGAGVSGPGSSGSGSSGSHGELLGVLDVDSPVKSRFDAIDQSGLEALAAVLVSLWPA